MSDNNTPEFDDENEILPESDNKEKGEEDRHLFGIPEILFTDTGAANRGVSLDIASPSPYSPYMKGHIERLFSKKNFRFDANL